MGSEYQKLGQTDLNKQDIQPSEIYQPDQRKPLNIIKTKVYCFHEKKTCLYLKTLIVGTNLIDNVDFFCRNPNLTSTQRLGFT